MRVIWSRDAERDRDAQIEFTALESPKAAAALGDAIGRAVDQLRTFPRSGRTGRETGTREMMISGTRFMLVYIVSAQAVEIVRMLHGAQRWPKQADLPDA